MPSASPPSRPDRREADPQLRLTTLNPVIDIVGDDILPRERAVELKRKPRFPVVHVGVLLVIAGAAALGTYALVPARYVGAVVLQVKPGKQVALQGIRTALMEEAQRLRLAGSTNVRWSLSSDWPVQVQASGADRMDVSRNLVRLAALFPGGSGAAADSAGPDAAVPLAADPVAMLRQVLTDSRERAERVRGMLAGPNPIEERSHSVEEIRQAGAEVLALRAKLDAAVGQLHALEQQRDPDMVAIDPALREKARAADVDVQQDAGELRVHLVDGRRQLLEAWQLCQPSLQALKEQAGRLADIDEEAATFGLESDAREMIETAAEAAGGYAQHIADFERQWSNEFAGLEQRTFDAPTNALTELHGRLEALLGDFVFVGRQDLKQLENQVDALSLATAKSAKNHEAHATLARTVRQLSTAQFHFERLAGQIRRSENLRLDAALQSAQSLYRRIEKRYAMIEDRLLQEAADQRALERKAKMEALSSELAELRQSESELLGRLMHSQEALLQTQDRSDAQVRLETELTQSTELADRLSSLLGTWEKSQGMKGETATRQMLAESLVMQEVRLPDRAVNAQTQLVSGGAAFLSTLFVGGLVIRHGRPLRPRRGGRQTASGL